MCRWFAYVSADEPCLLEDVLITPAHGLVHQVSEHYLPRLLPHDPTNITKGTLIAARNSLYNIDGLGVAWYTTAAAEFNAAVHGARPVAYKTICPPLNDLNFRSLCAGAASAVVFAHIRASSGTPVAAVNNHPFVFGRHCFMHNGVVSGFTEIRRRLCAELGDDAFGGVLGSADSEHVAALYMTYLTGGRGKESWELEYPAHDMAAALHKAVVKVIEIQQEVLGSRAAPNSLNLAVTDGRRLVAYRFRNHATEDPPSLYYSTTAGTTLNRKYPGHPNGGDNASATRAAAEHGSHVIIASEPTTFQEEQWSLIPRNSCLIVERQGVMEVEAVPYEDRWNAEDPYAPR